VTSEATFRETFELVAVTGPAQENLGPLFSALDVDSQNALHGVRDTPNQLLKEATPSVPA